MILKSIVFLAAFLVSMQSGFSSEVKAGQEHEKKLAYLASDLRIPFWNIMRKGVHSKAEQLGYHIVSYSAENSAKRELQVVIRAIKDRVDGIVVSPTNSSACATVLKLARQANIPVVISDIGTDSGEYVSYISSNNKRGAYQIGRSLAEAMKKRGWQQGRVGIIAIPQMRENGKERTSGFMQAIQEAGIKAAGIKQQVSFSYQETYDFSKTFIAENDDIRALWLQGSDQYQAALDAIASSGKKNEMMLVTFDAEPSFLKLIPQGTIVASGMQQPFLMGEKAVLAMHQHLLGQSIEMNQQVPVLAVHQGNIEQSLLMIRRNVLGLGVE